MIKLIFDKFNLFLLSLNDIWIHDEHWNWYIGSLANCNLLSCRLWHNCCCVAQITYFWENISYHCCLILSSLIKLSSYAFSSYVGHLLIIYHIQLLKLDDDLFWTLCTGTLSVYVIYLQLTCMMCFCNWYLHITLDIWIPYLHPYESKVPCNPLYSRPYQAA